MSLFDDLEDNAPSGANWGEPGESIAPNESSAPSLSPVPKPFVPEPELKPQPQPQPAEAALATTESASTTRAKRRKYRLAIKVTNVLPNNGDPVLCFDVNTNLPRFRSSTAHDVRRSYHELMRFYDHLSSANPECFVPTLPKSSTSFPKNSPEHQSTLVSKFQLWFNRITRSPLLARDEEFVHFVEPTTEYSPVVNIKPPATGLARKFQKQLQPPEDEITELMEFRPLSKLVYKYAGESQGRQIKVSSVRKSTAVRLKDLGVKVNRLTQVESKKGMINMWNKLGKVLNAAGDLENAKSIYGEALYADPIGEVSADAFSIKEALTNRQILMRDLEKAQQTSQTRHENVTKLKGSNNIVSVKVDEAILALEEATQTEKRMTSVLRRVSDNLLVEKQIALQRMEDDILAAVRSFALKSIDVERRSLANWESIRRDVRAVDKNGGLSRLGRTGVVGASGTSQSIAGDSWNGDRLFRAKELVVPTKFENEIVDARSAASLLADRPADNR